MRAFELRCKSAHNPIKKVKNGKNPDFLIKTIANKYYNTKIQSKLMIAQNLSLQFI
jgi:hypothetical protein